MDKKRDWMGKPILDSEHHGDLEMNAAVNQFGQKMTKEQAEAQAYNDYTKQHSEEAAAYHYIGIKQAHKAKDQAAARQHGLMYQKHMRNMGLDPMAAPPENILKQVEKLAQSLEPKYKYKPHKADVLMYSDALSKAIPGIPGPIARLGRMLMGRPYKGKFTILPRGAAEASAKPAAAPAQAAPLAAKPSKLEQELMPAEGGIHSQSPAEVMGFKGNPMKESGRQVIGRLKDDLGMARTGTKHQMKTPPNPKLATKSYKKDKNQVIDEGLAALSDKPKLPRVRKV